LTKKKVTSSKKKRAVQAKSSGKQNKLPLELIACFAIFVLGLIYMIRIESQYVDFGIDRDEAAYSIFGETLRTGGAMYKDAYSFKPPAIYYTYAAINTIFGYTPSGLRWSLIASNMLAAMLLFLFAFRWKGPVFALIAATAYLFFEFNPFVFGFAAVAEQYQNLFAILSLVLIQHGAIKKKWIYFLAGGFFMTFCVLIKQNMIFAYLALSAVLGWYYLFESKTRELKPLVHFVAGSAIAVVLIFVPLFVQGTFYDWIYWNFTYTKLYVSAMPWERGKELLMSFGNMVITRFSPWMWVAGIVGVIAGIVQAKPMAAKIGISLFLMAAIVSIFPGLRFYPHYWSYFSPILAIGCAWLVHTISRLLSMKMHKRWSHSIGILLFAAGIVYTIQNNDTFFDNPDELIVNRSLYGDNPFTETRYLGEYLKKIIQPDEQVLLFGSEPEIFNYLGRTPSRPDMFFSILLGPHERRDDMIKATQDWAQTNKPKYVFFSNHPFSWSMTSESDPAIYNWAYNYVKQNHKPIAIAEIISGQRPQIILGEQAETHQLTSDKWVMIFERVSNLN
jgi:4-amino-4-deoxy-L-arabinose transferase-like glycosyltransferase